MLQKNHLNCFVVVAYLMKVKPGQDNYGFTDIDRRKETLVNIPCTLNTIGQVFSRNFQKMCAIKSLLMKKFKRRGTHWFLLASHYHKKRINQHHLNHRFYATFRVLVLLEFFFLPTFLPSRKIGIFSESKAGCMVVLTDNPKYTI